MERGRYWSASKGQWAVIADMPTKHLENAVAKIRREAPTPMSDAEKWILADLEAELERRATGPNASEPGRLAGPARGAVQ